jgi:hypothetical protein
VIKLQPEKGTNLKIAITTRGWMGVDFLDHVLL